MPMKLYHFLKQSVALFMVLLLLSCFGATAFAYETVDIGRETSLAVYFGKDKAGFSGVEFRAYRVAEVSEAVQFTLTGDFTDYPVTVNGLDSTGWRALAQTLDGYVARDSLSPLQTARTGTDGYAKFSALPTGLYLVVGDRFREDRLTYTPESFLICLPNLDREADAWDYDPTVFCKYDSSSGDGTVTRKVLKVWKDDGKEGERPEEIAVQLLRDDKVYDTVTLNEKNNWCYTWNDLDGDYRWQVVERKTPEGYTVSVSREGITFVMTNTRTEEHPGGSDPGTPGEPNLPQTGMLWWPVPLLTCCGLLLFLIGWGVKRRERE